jgi:uncharacterized membrane protein
MEASRRTRGIRSLIRALVFIVPPAIALWLAAPAAMALLPWDLRNVDSLDPVNALSLAYYLGVLAAPGYLYAFVARAAAWELSAFLRWWVRLSLGIAVICSLVGVIAGGWMIFFAPPSLASLYTSSSLLRQFEGRRRKSAIEVSR